ncbi:hypothetical protein J5N97_012470 [Dioscorea zingiberensis]|uniref:Beta-glucosidase n=1 Tax=Dioscorea zingiberensis TaxID=325984 RepID=A0A9D5HHR4_9LILI|nr:hypothetical protein J5N97_012470 [Dioscorea zingiberensis]
MSLTSLPLSSNFPSSYSFTSPIFSGNPYLILPSVKDSKLPHQISKKKSTSLHIVCLRGSFITTNETAAAQTAPSLTLGRHSFPPGFTFGAASSAYQIEGAWNEGGRGPSIWDTFCHEHPEKIADRSNANVAVDSYHRYEEDVKLLKDMNVDAYRFSISWSRILPTGSLKGGVNQDGLNYYNDLINELLANGITPYATLFHWDVPQGLEDKYNGFLDKRIVNDFKGYCEVCFHEFGDRVKYWITLNEPWSFVSLGYGLGTHAPGRCSPSFGCSVGNSAIEPYIAGHNLILAHANAYRLYKEKYQKTQGGQIGITVNSLWYVPYDQTHENKEAANRLMDFMLGWYMDPLVRGDYPFNMKALVRERLPAFSKEESEMITKSFDFIGINYYSAMYGRSQTFSIETVPYLSIFDAWAEQLTSKDNVNIGPSNGSWLYIYPKGLKELLLFMKKRYGNPPVYITENGYSYVDKHDMSMEEAISDEIRRSYHALHLAQVRDAIADGADVKGYFAWSLTDNFEWEHGFTERFGLAYIDYNTLERTPKDSAKWFSKILEK